MSKVINIFGDKVPRAETVPQPDSSGDEFVEIETEEAMEKLQRAFRKEMDQAKVAFQLFFEAAKQTVTFYECAKIIGNVFQKNFVQRYEELMDFEFIPEDREKFSKARRDLIKLLANKYKISGISTKKKNVPER